LKSELEDEQFSICEMEGGRDEEPAAASSGDTKSNIGFHQQPLATLKKDCSTRWNFVVHAGECHEESRVDRTLLGSLSSI